MCASPWVSLPSKTLLDCFCDEYVCAKPLPPPPFRSFPSYIPFLPPPYSTIHVRRPFSPPPAAAPEGQNFSDLHYSISSKSYAFARSWFPLWRVSGADNPQNPSEGPIWMPLLNLPPPFLLLKRSEQCPPRPTLTFRSCFDFCFSNFSPSFLLPGLFVIPWRVFHQSPRTFFSVACSPSFCASSLFFFTAIYSIFRVLLWRPTPPGSVFSFWLASTVTSCAL